MSAAFRLGGLGASLMSLCAGLIITNLWILGIRPIGIAQAVHEQPARSVKALAERLGRDYKHVHEDVETLTASGLLHREGGGVS